MLVLRPCPKPPKAMGVGPAICAFTRLPALSGAGSRVGPIALESREDLPWAPAPEWGGRGWLMGWKVLFTGPGVTRNRSRGENGASGLGARMTSSVQSRGP